GVAVIASLRHDSFKHARQLSRADEVHLDYRKKGKHTLFNSEAQQERQAAADGHDREKKRYLELTRPFLPDLGVTNRQHELIPAMSRKWKQINKFLDVSSHALSSSPLKLDPPIPVPDFGAGQGCPPLASHDSLYDTAPAPRHG
ncbi:methyltransferase, partial [Pseudomonas syringae]